MMRLPTISRSDGKLSFEVVLVCSAMLLLLFCFPQIVIQPVVAVVPEAAVGLEPVVELSKRLRPQVVDALLGNRTDLDHTGVAEHPKMLGDLRLVEVELAGDFSHRSGPLAQELDDEEAIWFGEGSKRVQFERIYVIKHMPVKAYATAPAVFSSFIVARRSKRAPPAADLRGETPEDRAESDPDANQQQHQDRDPCADQAPASKLKDPQGRIAERENESGHQDPPKLPAGAEPFAVVVQLGAGPELGAPPRAGDELDGEPDQDDRDGPGDRHHPNDVQADPEPIHGPHPSPDVPLGAGIIVVQLRGPLIDLEGLFRASLTLQGDPQVVERDLLGGFDLQCSPVRVLSLLPLLASDRYLASEEVGER